MKQMITKLKKVLKPKESHEIHNEKGEEIPDPTPMAIDIGFRQPTLAERIAHATRHEISQLAAKQGLETLDEADDFDIPGEDMTSPWELEFDPQLGKEITKQEKAFLDSAREEAFQKLKSERQNQLKNKKKTPVPESKKRVKRVTEYVEDDEE